MDYIIQCLGDCAPQTPSSLLETPNKIFCLHPSVHQESLWEEETRADPNTWMWVKQVSIMYVDFLMILIMVLQMVSHCQSSPECMNWRPIIATISLSPRKLKRAGRKSTPVKKWTIRGIYTHIHLLVCMCKVGKQWSSELWVSILTLSPHSLIRNFNVLPCKLVASAWDMTAKPLSSF